MDMFTLEKPADKNPWHELKKAIANGQESNFHCLNCSTQMVLEESGAWWYWWCPGCGWSFTYRKLYKGKLKDEDDSKGKTVTVKTYSNDEIPW